MSHRFGLTPLHQAVIDGNVKATQALKGKYLECCDDLGFTPMELAQFLNRDECLEVLNPSKPPTFLVQLKGEAQLSRIEKTTLEDKLNFEYLPNLSFSSYSFLREVVENCPFILRSAWWGADNYAYYRQFRKQLTLGEIAEVSVRWIDENFGYGLFAERDFVQGDFLGEYTGELRILSRWKPEKNGYCLHYHTKWWSLKYFVIDALLSGNLMRFINHSDTPNVQPLCGVDRGLERQIFIAREPIAKGTQLTLNYGPDYWIKRQKL